MGAEPSSRNGAQRDPTTNEHAPGKRDPAAAGLVVPDLIAPAPVAPDPFAALIRRTMRLSVVEGSLMQVFLNWTTGSVLIGYLLHIGASPLHIALVGSVPLLSQVSSPLGAWAAEVLGRRKVLTIILAVVSRLAWLLAAFLPQLGLPAALQPTFLVFVVFVSSVFHAPTATVWTAWMGDVVPDDRRGRYFGMRTGVLGVVGTVANLAAGAFLDRVAAPLSFQLVLGVALTASLLAAALLAFHHDPPTERRDLRLKQVVLTPLTNPNFRRFLAFAAYWQFVIMLASPFVVPYFLEELGLSFTQVAVWSSIIAVTALFTTIRWGHRIDRVGNKRVLVIGTFLAGLLMPSMWIMAGLASDLNYVWLSGVGDAIAWGAVTPAVFNLALVTAPKSGRVSYIALYSLASGVAGFVGGVLSGPLLTLFTAIDWPGNWTGYHSLFALSATGRMLAWLFLARVREERIPLTEEPRL